MCIRDRENEELVAALAEARTMLAGLEARAQSRARESKELAKKLEQELSKANQTGAIIEREAVVAASQAEVELERLEQEVEVQRRGWEIATEKELRTLGALKPVSYTHLTLPTKRIV
eukprot:TRINITY_DN41583_c0_g1_i3.p1 TRINITY_DN41583_c0_g1~~TRINITY_DN41583_c0_g1_i3.p1  ORF type:complete len:117 (+),score=45.05 TRINITY_DN41583_c0_g1_i3:142-492(+)